MTFATASCIYSDADDVWFILAYSLDKITSKKKIFICPFYQSKAYTCIIWWTKMPTSSMRTFEIFDRRHTYSKYSDHVFEQLHCQPYYAFGYTRTLSLYSFQQENKGSKRRKRKSYFANVILKT
jgi:hypothetical protein